jgi:hypothetical protein
MSRKQEVADPAHSLVPTVDARAPRFNQALIGLAALAATVLHAWPLAGLAALQLALSLTLGPRACVACIIYFRWMQPHLGRGPVEDARPVRFANVIGLVFLSAVICLHMVGQHALDRVLASIVATLALTAAATGFCVGCHLYRLVARLRGIRRMMGGRIDLDEIGAAPSPGLVVQFTHPRCTDCIELEEQLRRQDVPLALVDVSRRPDLARKYGIALVPLAFRVGNDGRILARITAATSR